MPMKNRPSWSSHVPVTAMPARLQYRRSRSILALRAAGISAAFNLFFSRQRRQGQEQLDYGLRQSSRVAVLRR